MQVSEELIHKILNYLAQKPYYEVVDLINEIQLHIRQQPKQGDNADSRDESNN